MPPLTESPRPRRARSPAAVHPLRTEMLAILAEARLRIDRINGTPAR